MDFLHTYRNKSLGLKSLSICRTNNWLPLKPSPLLASIIGHLLGDGSLSKDRMTGDFRFYGKIQNLDKIKLILETEFSLIPYSLYLHPNRGGYILRYNNAIFARILELAGVPRGNKLVSEFGVPGWIMKGDRDIKKSFLRAILSDEMENIRKVNRKSWDGLRFGMSKDNRKLDHLIDFLNQIRRLLSEFKIKTSEIFIRKDKFSRKDGIVTCAARFGIKVRIENRSLFCSHIGFDDDEKQKILYSSIFDK